MIFVPTGCLFCLVLLQSQPVFMVAPSQDQLNFNHGDWGKLKSIFSLVNWEYLSVLDVKSGCISFVRLSLVP